MSLKIDVFKRFQEKIFIIETHKEITTDKLEQEREQKQAFLSAIAEKHYL